jgi:hypothetical protein
LNRSGNRIRLPEQGSVFTARSCDVRFTQREILFSFGGFEFLPHDGSKLCNRETDARDDHRNLDNLFEWAWVAHHGGILVWQRS